MEREKTVNEIITRDLVMGTFARESLECFKENKNMASLACLFILTEHAIKIGLDKTEGNLVKLLKEAKTKEIISEDEFYILNDFRDIRNKMFHENNYKWSMEINGINYPFYEDETKKIIYDAYSDICFRITLKCLSMRTDYY